MAKKRSKYRVVKVNTLVDAFQAAMSWAEEDCDSNHVWFRGATCNRHALTPGAYREGREGYKEVDPLLDLVQGGSLFGRVGEIDDWETYYLAQHHSVPTRLLDWTESFVTALFFALDGWDRKGIPCVWMLKPDLMNFHSIGWRGIISPEQNPELGIWLPRKINTGPIQLTSNSYHYDSRKPLGIYPRMTNTRIVAQQGTFTIHGTERVSLEAWVNRHENADKILFRVDMPKIDENNAIRQLGALGVKRHTIYPDLDNFVRHLRTKHGW